MTKISYKKYIKAKQICRQYEVQLQTAVNDKQISDCKLSVPIIDYLHDKNIKTLGELRVYHSIYGIRGIHRIRGMGRKYQEEIRIELLMSKDEFYKNISL